MVVTRSASTMIKQQGGQRLKRRKKRKGKGVKGRWGQCCGIVLEWEQNLIFL
jgi:hypothetical protein